MNIFKTTALAILPLFFTTVLMSALVGRAALAEDIAGVDMPNTIDAGGQTLTLQGGGVRERFFIDLYVAGLYLAEASSDAESVIEADSAMAMRLEIVSSQVSQSRMEKAIRNGFSDVMDEDVSSLAAEIDRFVEAFKPEVSKGDVLEFVYRPGNGTQVIKNGQPATRIDGAEFKRSLFAIWLSDNAVQKSLRKALLGG